MERGGNQALHDLGLTQEEADQLNEFASAAAAAQAAALEAEAAANPEMADLILNQAEKYRASSEVFLSRVGVSVGWRVAGDAIQAMEAFTGLSGLYGNAGKAALTSCREGRCEEGGCHRIGEARCSCCCENIRWSGLCWSE